MREHDVAFTEDTHAGVLLVCSCGHRVERPTDTQARKAHGDHWGLEMSREALDKKHTFGRHPGTPGPRVRLACSSCSFECALAPDLHQHVTAAHHRFPTVDERTPVADE